MKDEAPSPMGLVDPPRLLAAKTDQARLLRLYARQTLPGNPDGVASWYRLRARLDDSDPPSLPAYRGLRVGRLCGFGRLQRRWHVRRGVFHAPNASWPRASVNG